MNGPTLRRATLAAAIAAAAILIRVNDVPAHAQAVPRDPTAVLVPAPAIAFDSGTDSNSPAIWERLNGRPTLFLFTSFNGWPTRQTGTQVANLADAGAIAFVENGPLHGVWLEAIIPDVDGTWYGYYHNELPAEICGEDDRRTLPRMGAARLTDHGESWEDLGVILEAPAGWHDCASTNRYFVGGVGDFSAVLDADARYLYFFFSQYGDREQTQGVAIGRMVWANRDRPAGKVSVWWRDSTWVPTRRPRGADAQGYAYPAGVPIYRVRDGWHDDQQVDAFWGPSVHWNTYLQQDVMLLNRANDVSWRQEGIDVAFASALDNPADWSDPQRLIAGGLWYPQVIGTETGSGTDKVAGERARFFMGGRSQYFIQFSR